MNKGEKLLLDSALDVAEELKNATSVEEALDKASFILIKVKVVKDSRSCSYASLPENLKFASKGVDMLEEIQCLEDAMEGIKMFIKKVKSWKKYHYEKVKTYLDDVTTKILTVI